MTVTYNAADFIGEYLESLLSVFAAMPNLSLVAVDNLSNDETTDIVESFAAEHGLSARLRVVKSGENLGFGRGCNLGADVAKAEFKSELLWFLNPDTKIDVSAAEVLISLLSDGKADFVGSSLCDESQQIRSGAFRFPTPLTVLLSTSLLGLLAKIFPGSRSTIELAEHPVESDWLTGASFMVKQSVFEQLNGFDKAYFLYFEEVDLFVRAKRGGFMILSSPDSVVYHASGASTGMNQRKLEQKAPRRPSFWFESRRYFYLKNYGAFTFLLTDCAFVVGTLVRKLKNRLNGIADTDPDRLLSDIIQHSVIVKGTSL